MKIKERIAKLRQLMETERIQAYLVPSTDPHQSEYPPEFWKRRQYISGFTGSAGDVAITMDQGGLWTDGRYFLQAESQLKGTGLDLFKMLTPDVPKLEEWLAEKLAGGGALGVDPRVLSVEAFSDLKKALEEKGASVKTIDRNLVDEIWEQRPSPSDAPLEVLPVEITGQSTEQKLKCIREKMAKKDCSCHVLCSLDAIAWTFNMRGKDIDYNPVFISYALITTDKAMLFMDPGKATESVRKHLDGLAEIRPYEKISDCLKLEAEKGAKFWIDPKATNKWLMLPLEGMVKIHKERSPVTDLKSVKNETELQGFATCMATDGVAMIRFLKWLEESVPEGGVTEISAADKLESFRRQGDGFVGLSFPTIAGYAEHGAIIHYQATPETDVPLKPRGLLLVDSGAQYRTGTTDITRTVALGDPTDEQREMFTRVLKGHIGIATLKFPKGCSGRQLELAARKPLWDIGKNYNHGTGHGVGHYLNVHEGPMAISSREPGVPLQPGNVLSNEPGYYKTGEYGIRIENLVVVEKQEELSTEDLGFLCFDTITLCPIDTGLVATELLTEEEMAWLDDYHRQVYDRLCHLLDEDHRIWLWSEIGRLRK